MESLRIDKWLWAARFYRTRSLAKQAIESGRVHLEGARVKVSKEVRVGMRLQIRQGHASRMEEKEVVILTLSDKRGSAPAAQALYEETPESLSRREQFKEAKRMSEVHFDSQKPSKKQRRQHDSWLFDQEFFE